MGTVLWVDCALGAVVVPYVVRACACACAGWKERSFFFSFFFFLLRRRESVYGGWVLGEGKERRGQGGWEREKAGGSRGRIEIDTVDLSFCLAHRNGTVRGSND